MKRRAWKSMLLTLVMLFGMFPGQAFAAEAPGSICLNVEIEENAFKSVMYQLNETTTTILNVNNNILNYTYSLYLNSGDKVTFRTTLATGITFDGYYLGATKLSGDKITTFTAGTDFKDGDTIRICTPSNLFQSVDYTGDAVTLETRSAYPWINTDGVLASGSKGALSDSVLKVTAQQSGTLIFKYMADTISGSGCLLYKKGTELTKANFAEADNYAVRNEYAGTQGWKDGQLEVVQGDEVYFLYYKSAASGGAGDTVYLKDFAFAADGYAVVANASDSDCGTATVTASSVEVGTEVTFTATPAEGCKFYGWVKNGEYITADTDYTTSIYADTTLTAVFAPEGGLKARISGTFYSTLEEALTAAATATAEAPVTVIQTDDATLSEDVTVPAHVTLLIPFDPDLTFIDMGNMGGQFNTRLYSNSWSNGLKSNLTPQGENVTYTLTVAQGKTLTVPANAQLTLGGLYSGSATPIAGQTYGAHSEIKLESGAELNVAGGILSCCGYIYGEGQVNVTDGGSAYENFVVTDFHGGTDFLGNFTNGVFPFCGYLVLNIQANVVADSSAYLYGYCTLPAGGQFYNVAANVLGDGGLIELESESTMTLGYDQSKTVGVFGTTEIAIDGDASIGSMTLDLAGTEMDTSKFVCPLPYSISLEQQSGELTIDAKMRLMPGNEFTVAPGASVAMANGSQLILEDSEPELPEGSPYPDAAKLSAANYGTAAVTDVQGSLTLEDGATLTCNVPLATNGDVIISVATGATVSGTMTNDGNATTLQNGTAYTYTDGVLTTETLEPTYYTVTYHRHDGTVETESLVYGAAPTLEPTAACQDEQYEYYYCWVTLSDGKYTDINGALPKVTGNTEYYEQEYKTARIYKVYFWTADGEYIQMLDCAYGEKPEYTGAEQTKAEDELYTYTFAGWAVKGTGTPVYATDDLPEVTGETNYQAVFTRTPKPGTVVLTEANFTDKTKAAAAVTITNAATGEFTVTCEKACVVAIANADGSYTRVSATAVTGEDYTYSFVIDGEFDNTVSLVVAIKGDLNNDGVINTTDISQVRTLSKDPSKMTMLRLLCGDVNKDGKINTTDISQIRTVSKETRAFDW